MPRKETRPLTEFGRFIKDRIAALGFKNQAEFLRITHFIPMTLNRYMRDPEPKPDYDTFGALAVALGMDRGELQIEFERSRSGDQSTRAARHIAEPDLDAKEIKDIVTQRRESSDVIGAMSKLYTSLGPIKHTPRTYVIAALSALARELRAGKTEDAAIEIAKRDANEALTKANAKAAGITPLQTPVHAPPAGPQTPTSPDSSNPPPPSAPQRRKSGARR